MCLHGRPGVPPAGESERRAMHCGWLDESTWTPGKPQTPLVCAGVPYEGDVCPGWLVRLPDVQEGARAYYAATEIKALETYFPDPDNHVLEAVEILTKAFAAFRNELYQSKAPPTR